MKFFCFGLAALVAQPITQANWSREVNILFISIGTAFKLSFQYFFDHFVISLRNSITSTLSCDFINPGNAIFVFGMYRCGFSRYSKRVSSFQIIPKN
jgi:hypothetical protein